VRTPRIRLRRAAIWVGLLVSAAFAYLAVRNAHVDEVWSALKSSDYEWVLPALAVMTVAFFVRALRWQMLFASARRPPFRRTASALYVAYLFNNILPARAGEAARILALNRRAQTPIAEASGTVLVERTLDLLSLLLLLFVTLPWLPELSWILAAGFFAGALLLAIAATVVALALFREQPFAFAARHLGRLPILSGGRLKDAPTNLLHGLLGLRSLSTGLVGLALTTASWLVLAVGFWLVTVAFDLGVSFLAGLLVVIAVGLGMILPSSPAALGVFEGATVLALAAYGIPDSEAVSYALVLHALNALPFLVLAPLLLRPYRTGVSPNQPDGELAPVREVSRT
jgi:uncharacterized membrane protein YbhN (UPF0104 family)